MQPNLDTSIPITIELGAPLDDLIALPAVKAFKKSLEIDLVDLLRRLGLPGVPRVRLLNSASGRAVRLRVHGQPVLYAPKLASRAWAASLSTPEAQSAQAAVFAPEAPAAQVMTSAPEVQAAQSLTSASDAEAAPAAYSAPEAQAAQAALTAPDAQVAPEAQSAQVMTSASDAEAAPRTPDAQTGQTALPAPGEPVSLRDLPEQADSEGQAGFPDGWLAHYYLDPQAIEDLPSRQGLVLDFLRRLVLEAIQELPSCLVSAGQVAAFGQANAAGSTDLEPVMKALLDLWVPLRDAELVCQVVQGVHDQGCPPEDAVEELFARLHARRIEIHIHPGYLQQLLPEIPLRGPVSVYDSRLPQAAHDLFQLLADGVYYELGLRLPDMALVPSLGVRETAFQIKINSRLGAPIQGLEPGELLVNATVDYLRGLMVPSRLAKRPNDDAAAAIVEASQRAAVEADGIYIWAPLDYVVLALTGEIYRNATRLLGMEEVEYEVAQLHASFTDLVLAVLERFSLAEITRLLRGLLQENVSIQNLPVILEQLLLFETVPVDSRSFIVLDGALPVPDWMPVGSRDSWQNHLEFVRMGLKHQIAQKYEASTANLSVYLIDPDIENRLDGLVQQYWTGSGFSKAQEAWLEQLRDVLWTEVRAASQDMRRTPVLTISGQRLPLRLWLAAEFPSLPVISYSEIPADINITPISRITFV